MNPKDPQTWDNLAKHPAFEPGEFDPNWYDGDVEKDLLRLRDAVITILNDFPTWSCDLDVLDDCTFYAIFKNGNLKIASLYPATTSNFEQCFFLDIEEFPEEIRTKTSAELVSILRAQQKLEEENRCQI